MVFERTGWQRLGTESEGGQQVLCLTAFFGLPEQQASVAIQGADAAERRMW